MKHSVTKYLEDIRLSITDIEHYTADVNSYIQIENNQLLFDALCRRFAIIGEAVFQIGKHTQQIAITEKEKIAGLRHIIVHDFDMVSADMLWMIIIKKLPLLKTEVTNLLNTTNENSS